MEEQGIPAELNTRLDMMQEKLDDLIDGNKLFMEREMRFDYVRDELERFINTIDGQSENQNYTDGMVTGLKFAVCLINVTLATTLSFARAVQQDLKQWEKEEKNHGES